MKVLLSWLLQPFAWMAIRFGERLSAIWAFAHLKASIPGPLDRTNVILGKVAVEGTGQVSIGRGVRIYPGVVLETQERGQIVIGDNAVLSRGVHIVAFDKVVLGNNCMVGEHSSIRDADHRHSLESMRRSGHRTAPVQLGDNVWIGCSCVLLKGVHIGSHSIVGANAVVTHDVPERSCAVGAPARSRLLPIPV